MAKLGRVLQKIFGINATTGGVGVGQLSQIGSFAASSPTTENPNDAGALAMQGNSNYLGGWFFCVSGGNSPCMEDMNSLHFLVTRQLAYLFQEGVAEWDSTTTYYTGSIVQDGNGNLYVSRVDTNLGHAVTNPVYWKQFSNGGLNPQTTQQETNRAMGAWTASTISETNNFEDICWSPDLGLFCAVTYDGTHQVWTSPDGTTWTARSASVSKLWTGICWSPEKKLFCAVAQDNLTTNAVMTSPDGTTWTTRTAASTGHFWVSVTWSPALGLFCAVGSSGGLMTSPDGVTWTSRTAAESNNLADVVWSPQLNLFVIVSNDGTHQVQTSPDGVTWTARTAPAASWQSIAWSPQLGAFVATDNGGLGKYMISYDGINWTSGNLPDPGATYEGVCWAAEIGVFIVTSQDATHRIAYSFDGVNWTGVSGISSHNYVAVAWSGKLGLAVAVTIDSSGTFITSRYIQKFIAP